MQQAQYPAQPAPLQPKDDSYNQGAYPPQYQNMHTYSDPQQAQYAPQGQYVPPAPPGQYMQPSAQQPPMSTLQVAEQYRANLYAQCAQGIHQPSTKYGVFGIIVAVVCFPCGLLALLFDKESKCDRCGVRLS